MVDIKFYEHNLHKTFEEIAKQFAKYYHRSPRKNFFISKKFYDWLGNYQTRSAMETYLGTLLMEEMGGEFIFVVKLTVAKFEDMFDTAYYLMVEAADGDDYPFQYYEIVEKKQNEKELMEYLNQLK